MGKADGRDWWCRCIPVGFLGRHRAFPCPAKSRVTLGALLAGATMPHRQGPRERAPFLYEPSGRSRPSSKFCRLEVTLQAKLHARWGTRGAAAPGELPGSVPARTAGFEASGRFCRLAGLKHVARCTHAGQPGVCRWGDPHHCPSKPSEMERAPQTLPAAGEASQEREAETVKVAGK